jgi:hypothetical protein
MPDYLECDPAEYPFPTERFNEFLWLVKESYATPYDKLTTTKLLVCLGALHVELSNWVHETWRAA